MSKIRQHFNTFELIRAFAIAILGSAFIYLHTFGLTSSILNTIFAILFFYLLLSSHAKTWFFTGFFIGILWFWWIALSFIIYELTFLIPLVVLFIGVGYGLLFMLIAYLSSKLPTHFHTLGKAIGLLALSYIHPFGFDWFKPELVFIQSYIGISKWQFTLVLLSIVITLATQKRYWLALILFAYHPTPYTSPQIPQNLQLVTTHVSISEKWDPNNREHQAKHLLETIDKAITQNKATIVFPESVLPYFLNRETHLMDELKQRAQKIHIILGALFWDGRNPYNSTYIFTKAGMAVAHKVVLVPFGEANPLPDFLSDWINQIFYDGAIDYIASHEITDYTLNNTTYRNAICFEATSEKLYTNTPKHLIVLSNNGWFTPSIEPALQQLLLLYYHKKYGTTIYHSINMSQAYIIKEGQILFVK